MNVQRTIPPPPGDDTGYETDFHLWLERQADALRAGDAARLDLVNLLEEVETLGRSERNELFNRLTTIIEHLLKYEHGAERDPAAGWKRTILVQRQQANRNIQTSPSLRRLAHAEVQSLFQDARQRAVSSFETHEPHRLATYEALIPKIVPYTLDQILDIDYLPEPNAAR